MESLFLLVLGNTEISLIPGISVAGATPELTKFTPPADAEYLFYEKPRIINAIPVTPEGHPTPAIITKASRELAKFPILVVRGGSYLAPLLPHVHISDIVGRDFRKEKAIPKVEEIIERTKLLGEELNRTNIKELVIGESTPGGTTTAQAVLWALGYDAKTSSASPRNPQELKEKVIKEGFERVGIKNGDLKNEPIKALAEFGDPTLATILGISMGFKRDVVLAGGTQMLAVAALLKALGEDLSRFMIATTKWVVNDESATFLKTAREIGIITYSADLDFSGLKYRGLQDYEKGYVKEGVGAGGSVWLAVKAGFSPEDVARKVEELYERLISRT
ncbi:nicotinate mononucleotide-dependent phosphoribosyltransferase CobT [Pyrococcus sp. ST04]|uniref:nicotinate mononucleotide-dependent phosphoribosyltransferase CobT n=1 Tax=Pyrococcus sp. ST04 TaxID=1183377 RepID=UPI0002605A77|nr:TIGR00303 family protein [Pyrococcus sp. ST04]AFK22056.1 putative Nicotinate-nucleotide-dimethylbenzimidazole phosphoribosyltransferase [Pyrococcus sp. ST04]